jgi:biopolymer transport protein ExbB
MPIHRPYPWTRLALLVVTACVVLALLTGPPRPRVHAQALDEAGPSAEAPPSGEDADAPPVAAPRTPPDRSINVLDLATRGGVFMIPITAMSLLAVTMIIERMLGLRRQKVMPDELVGSLGQLGTSPGGFDPRKAYRICQQYPSAAANVIRAMLLKVGRPLSEVEHTVQEASEREAARLYGNVRWLNLCASLTPLLGLLGTVQGMIIAFHQTTVLDPGQNKSIELAAGIYTALVTTFAGLCVAIPAALMSHYFEGRIQNLFHQIDELVFSLLPQVERYEGRVRFSRHADDAEPAEEHDRRPATEPVPPPAPAQTA